MAGLSRMALWVVRPDLTATADSTRHYPDQILLVAARFSCALKFFFSAPPGAGCGDSGIKGYEGTTPQWSAQREAKWLCNDDGRPCVVVEFGRVVATVALRALRARHHNCLHDGRQTGSTMTTGDITERQDMAGHCKIWPLAVKSCRRWLDLAVPQPGREMARSGTQWPNLVAPPVRPCGQIRAARSSHSRPCLVTPQGG